mmetsp:Transcript_3878/g.12107  ORF Transcript_3878/g.12107 Transcript_3878/m.12107 type:complete len:200 (-) Transcript_3878:11-610(-)
MTTTHCSAPRAASRLQYCSFTHQLYSQSRSTLSRSGHRREKEHWPPKCLKMMGRPSLSTPGLHTWGSTCCSAAIGFPRMSSAGSSRRSSTRRARRHSRSACSMSDALTAFSLRAFAKRRTSSVGIESIGDPHRAISARSSATAVSASGGARDFMLFSLFSQAVRDESQPMYSGGEKADSGGSQQRRGATADGAVPNLWP